MKELLSILARLTDKQRKELLEFIKQLLKENTNNANCFGFLVVMNFALKSYLSYK